MLRKLQDPNYEEASNDSNANDQIRLSGQEAANTALDDTKIRIRASSTNGDKGQKMSTDQDADMSQNSEQSDWQEKGYVKTFAGIPNSWHETIQVRNAKT